MIKVKTKGSSSPSDSWKSKNPGFCAICLMKCKDLNSMLVCCNSECPITYHIECYYNGKTNTKVDTNWKCFQCYKQEEAIPETSPFCIACPEAYGGPLLYIKDTDYLIHHVCALWLNKQDIDPMKIETMGPVELKKKLEHDWFYSQCYLCRDEVNAQSGLKLPCDAHGCKRYIHITCAQKYRLIEKDDDPNMIDPFFVFCKQHGSIDPILNGWEKWKKQMPQKTKLYSNQNEHHRSLQRLFRLEHDVIRYNEEFEKLTNTFEYSNDDLSEETLLMIQEEDEFTGVKSDLLAFLKSIDQQALVYLKDNDKKFSLNLPDFLEDRHLDILSKFLPKIKSDFETRFGSISEWYQWKQENKKEGHQRVCSICQFFDFKAERRDNWLMQCDTCGKYYHAKCLDPPLTKRQPRGYVWQCEDCDSSEEEEENEEKGSSVDEPLTKRTRRSVYATID